jgi:hypothetical protein
MLTTTIIPKPLGILGLYFRVNGRDRFSIPFEFIELSL